MKKLILFLAGCLFFCLPSQGQEEPFGTSFNQGAPSGSLYIVDSATVLHHPRPRNMVKPEDIADIRVIRNKDSLRLLKREGLDSIIYIFTRAYRSRPDSLKKIPSLNGMKLIDGAWHLGDVPYSGKFIEYFVSGKIRSEGTLSNGRQHGGLVQYYPDGRKKFIGTIIYGTANGTFLEYYQNGGIQKEIVIRNDRDNGRGKAYFINGRVEKEFRPKNKTRYDSSFTYFSSGTVRQMRLIRNGHPVYSRKEKQLNRYVLKFFTSLQENDIRAANKYFFQTWKRDNTSMEAFYREGLLNLREFQFDQAIASFDKVLQMEPLLRQPYLLRAYARIKKYQYKNREKKFLYLNAPPERSLREDRLGMEDLSLLPKEELDMVNRDLEQARYLKSSAD